MNGRPLFAVELTGQIYGVYHHQMASDGSQSRAAGGDRRQEMAGQT
jgi:hypothetical protein